MVPITSSNRSTTSVLIIGAGPTGLMMAGQLAQRGVPFRILDKNADHTTQSRALVVQARSLEIFDQMEIAQEAIRLGEKAKAVNVIVRGKQVLAMELGDVGAGLTAYPFLLILEQSKTISQIGIHYRQSSLSQEESNSHFPRHAPKPGDRVPYLPTTATATGTRELGQGTKFHLVLFPGPEVTDRTQKEVQTLQQAYPDLITCVQVPFNAETEMLYTKFGIEGHGYYFIRPDGYIAYRSSSLHLQNISQYLQQSLCQGHGVIL
jgi:hypothetical protein